jgi:hypothetical protein
MAVLWVQVVPFRLSPVLQRYLDVYELVCVQVLPLGVPPLGQQ